MMGKLVISLSLAFIGHQVLDILDGSEDVGSATATRLARLACPSVTARIEAKGQGNEELSSKFIRLS